MDQVSKRHAETWAYLLTIDGKDEQRQNFDEGAKLAVIFSHEQHGASNAQP
jgi:hypothetical protein